MRREVRGATTAELDDVLAFLEGRMGAAREFFDSRFQTCPPAQPQDSRIAVVDGKMVSHARVYRRNMRLRGSVIAAGHLAEVLTHPDHRREGHGRAVLRDCVEHIRRLGFPLSCVWTGATQFYCCEGWVRFPLVSTSLQIPSWKARTPAGVRVRKYRRGHDDATVAEIHAEYNRHRNLSAVRDADYWRLHYSWIRCDAEDGFLIAERDGKPVGYCRAGTAQVIEYGVLPGHDDAGVALIDAQVRRAGSAQTLPLDLPVDETLITQQPQLRYSCSVNELMLMRVVDVQGVLESALETSSDRLRGVEIDEGHTIAIEVLGQRCAIVFRGGCAGAEPLPPGGSATPLAQPEFFRLIFGSHLEKNLGGFPDEDQRLLRKLFPPDGPVWWRPDSL